MNKQVEKISPIAKNYANALIDVAQSNHIPYEQMLSDFETILDAFSNSQDLQIIIENSSVEIIKKFEIIDEIFKNKILNELINFLKILIEKKRISDLPQIYAETKRILYKKNNIQPVTIISAIALNPEQQQQITETLTRKLQKVITPDWVVNPEIIAGLKIEIEDNILDLSIQHKIKELEKSLILK